MRALGLDFGSSSVKAAILHNGRLAGKVVRADYPTRFDGVRAEIDPDAVLRALKNVVAQLGPAARKIDCIALDALAASWVAMDRRGTALTPIITHQDRRSIEQARRIEKTVGKARHLQLAGNRPIPGGISSTTWAWFLEDQPGLLKRADLVGHLTTFLLRTLTGARVCDPSNASFMGVYSTLTLSGWNAELCQAVGVDQRLLPELRDADEIGGRLTEESAKKFGLTSGTPVLTGLIDTGAAMLLSGAKIGQLLNVCGSTDVLALCTDRPRPDERLLTRALGVGKKWLSVGTLAAGGSSLNWAHRELFADLSAKAFWKLVHRAAAQKIKTEVRFDPYLAGDRMSIEQRTAAFSGITLATTRAEFLAAIIESLATASAQRLPLLAKTGTKIHRDVMLSGGAAKGLAQVFHRDWPGRWRFYLQQEASLRGLAKLAGSGPLSR
jgi:xylulokinase